MKFDTNMFVITLIESLFATSAIIFFGVALGSLLNERWILGVIFCIACAINTSIAIAIEAAKGEGE